MADISKDYILENENLKSYLIEKEKDQKISIDEFSKQLIKAGEEIGLYKRLIYNIMNVLLKRDLEYSGIATDLPIAEEIGKVVEHTIDYIKHLESQLENK